MVWSAKREDTVGILRGQEEGRREKTTSEREKEKDKECR